MLKLAGVLVVGLIAAALDTTMTNVALDRLGAELRASVSTVQWVGTGYLLAYAMVVPLVGWLTARFGTRRLWLASLTVFFAGSVLCGAAWNIGSLVAWRVVQGAGGGMMLVLLQTVLAQAAGPGKLGWVMSIAAMPAMLAPVFGPIVGGLIVSHLSWRWIFYVNVPTCVIGVVLAWRVLPAAERGPVSRLDVRGLLLLAPALAAVIYGMSEAGSTGGFGSGRVLWPLAVGLLLLTLFTAHSLTTRHAPIIDLRLLRVRSYGSGIAVTFIMGFGIFASMLVLPLYYQQAQDSSALAAGVLMAPQGAGFFLGLIGVGRLADVFSPRLLVLTGIVVTCAGTLAYTQVAQHPGGLLLGASLFIRGLGMSAATVPAIAAMYDGLDRAVIPEATSSQRIFQQVGASFGTAVLAVVLQWRIGAHPGHLLDAFGDTFWWTLALSGTAVIPALFLPSRRTRPPRGTPTLELPANAAA
ncbi:MDR family MFS transporter [Streptomyces chartreusis]|uniref:MDR family MFS transporter n=1 Tax=Streptomyces chartreusis TaxID=1969 RepID=UPI003722E96F